MCSHRRSPTNWSSCVVVLSIPRRTKFRDSRPCRKVIRATHPSSLQVLLKVLLKVLLNKLDGFQIPFYDNCIKLRVVET